MKAFVIDGYGGPERMRAGELPEPTPRKGEVVVDVVASSVNPVDWKIRAGELRLISGSRFPRPLGTEFAGVVHSLGAGVSGWAAGDPVYGLAVTAMGRWGAHAERVAVPAGELRRKPAALPFAEAATLPVAALTALNGFRLYGDLGGKTVLVNGATGGVGHFAVQIAKARGAARVAAVCSAAKADFARQLGADVVFDYRTDELARSRAQFDVVYDAFGHLGFGAACQFLAPRGAYVTPLGLPTVLLRSLWQNPVGRRRLIVGNVRTEPGDYEAIEAMIAAGSVRPRIDRVVPLEKAAEAFAALEGGGVAGKVVVRVREG
ncbi:MAG: NADP-dependent oxidoreductase [Myxococcales bacterium]